MKTLVPVSFEIGKNITLAGVEEQFKRVEECDSGGDALLHLARHLGSNFFVESRVAALIATLASSTSLTVRDWHREWDRDEVNRFFKARLSGFSAAMNAFKVDNDSSQALPTSRAELREETDARGGVLERNLTVEAEPGNAPFLPGVEMSHHPEGRSITICAVDSPERRAIPFVFTGLMQDGQGFGATLLELKRRYLERGRSSSFAGGAQWAAERALAAFVFETFQNSFEHGCLDEDGRIIPGVRSIMLRKHVSSNPRAFLSRAKGYPQLEQYLRTCVAESAHSKLLEVSVSDQGLGILRRLRATVPAGSLPEGRDLSLLQRVIEDPLTSKIHFPGAGQGLARVSNAVQELDGFLSVRTGNCWLSFGPDTNGSYCFSGVDESSIVGTHINLLFPLRAA